MTDEEKLFVNLKKRRLRSLENIIDVYTPYVSVIVYNIIGAAMTKEDVEEVVSDVFVALWRNIDSVDAKKGGLRAYLGAVARNCAKNKLRSAAVCDELNENAASVRDEPNREIEDKERRQMLLYLIKNLGEPDDEIFMRYYYYEERISKISAVTGIKQSTITTKLDRGRKKLREALIKRGYGNEEKIECF